MALNSTCYSSITRLASKEIHSGRKALPAVDRLSGGRTGDASRAACRLEEKRHGPRKHRHSLALGPLP
ncbi:hypothetical protein K270103H11_11790 [Gordonibacter urolithinfaciens]